MLIREPNGFTFTELLLVLSITFTITSAVIFVGNVYTETQLVNSFLRQLTLDLYAVQSHAIGEQKSARLEFVAGGTEYVALGNTRQLLFRRTLPYNLKLSTNSPMRDVVYNPNGAVVKFGTMQFATDKGEIISVRLQFGRGRVVLPEQ